MFEMSREEYRKRNLRLSKAPDLTLLLDCRAEQRYEHAESDISQNNENMFDHFSQCPEIQKPLRHEHKTRTGWQNLPMSLIGVSPFARHQVFAKKQLQFVYLFVRLSVRLSVFLWHKTPLTDA